MNKQHLLFTARLAREVVGWTGTEVADTAAALMKHRGALQGIALRACNGCPRPGDARATESRESGVLALLVGTGIKPIFCDDPRGCALKLRLVSGITDDFAGEGLCVPMP